MAITIFPLTPTHTYVILPHVYICACTLLFTPLLLLCLTSFNSYNVDTSTGVSTLSPKTTHSVVPHASMLNSA